MEMDYMLKERFMNRINSDRADSTSVSMILWIVFTVVLVITVGGIIFNAVKNKGTSVGNCISNSNTVFGGGDSSCANSAAASASH
jgi:hypothetical protein